MAQTEIGVAVEQLFILDTTDGEARLLTQNEWGVVDYAPSPLGGELVYADKGGNLWLVSATTPNATRNLADTSELLVQCAPAQCGRPQWHPDGNRVLYERRVTAGDTATTQLWWLDVAAKRTLPVFDDDSQQGYSAALAPDGEKLVFYDPASEAFIVYTFETGEAIEIATRIDLRPTWHPSSDSFIYSTLQPAGEQFIIRLIEFHLESGRTRELLSDGLQDDGSAAWSPDGLTLAFGRKQTGTAMGRQLWLYDVRDSTSTATGAKPQTQDADWNHAQFHWSAGSDKILIQRFQITGGSDYPAIWLFDTTTQRLISLRENARQPDWLQ